MKFSICLEMIFPELEFPERIDRVAEQGFDHIEFWGWTEKEIEAIQERLDRTSLGVTNFSAHRRSSPILAEDRLAFLEEVDASLEMANQLGCNSLMLLSDALTESSAAKPADLPWEEAYLNLLRALEQAAALAERDGLTLVIESLNLHDHPGYFLNRSRPAFQLIRTIGNPALKVLYDIYHMQISEGNIITTIRENIEAIGYFHAADVPGRGEPGSGELNYRNIFRAIQEAGYDRTIGFEFAPIADDVTALKAIRELIQAP
ncbi:MAG: hydroxypyruvate isomerase family protein [Candidatus Bipolaricaulia bacterium]